MLASQFEDQPLSFLLLGQQGVFLGGGGVADVEINRKDPSGNRGASFFEAFAEHGDDLLANVRIEVGSARDYAALAQFHYKGAKIGVVTTVCRMVHETRSVVGRYVQRRSDKAIIGVILRALPHLACSLRDVATRGRYREGLTRRESAIMLNREMRTISRVVIHPQWRGLGLAVMLVKHALANAEPGVIYTEALAAMGHVHPFFERAGMMRYERPPRPSKLDPFKDEIHALLERDAKLTGVRVRELIEPLGFEGSRTIVDDYLREVRPLFIKLRTHQRTIYRPGEICQWDLWEPSVAVPVGHGQLRRGGVVVACLGTRAPGRGR
jgi:GNAT superfamily N-acetyltransferase